VLTKVLVFLLAGAILSFLLLLVLGLIRLLSNLVLKFVRTGGLQRHGYLALIFLALSLAIGVIAAYSVDIYRGWIVIFVVSGLSIATLIPFLRLSQTYYFSNRWLANGVLALALISLALVPLAEWFLPTGSAHGPGLILAAAALAALGGILFMWPAIRQIKLVQVLLGALVAGLLAGAAFALWRLDTTLVLISFLGFVATLDWFNLRGSGRRPALLLIYCGIAVAAVLFDLLRYVPKFWGLGILISCAGYWHVLAARLPKLTKVEANILPDKRAAMGLSVMILVRRMISQVYFESGWGGIQSFGQSFTRYTKSLGMDLSITGNQFKDGELSQRATFDLAEIYGLAFDEIFSLMKRRFGEEFTRKTIGLGIDLVPWQYREVVGELVLERRAWGAAVNREKGGERAERIQLLDRVPLFLNATYEDLEPIAAMLTAQQYAAREVVIRQGDPGDTFYIIERGKLQIWQQQGDEPPGYVQSLGPGQSFGEAALVTDQPRNATVIAETPVVLLTLGRADFDALVREHLEFAQSLKVNLRHSWVLRNMPIFDEMSAYDLVFLTSKLKPEQFNAGATVIQQDDQGDKFYVIESGELAAYHASNGASVEVERLFAGDYFGETALISDRPRNASVVTLTDCSLFSLHRDDFVTMLGNFQNMKQLLERTSTRRTKNTSMTL
jgi:cAMP-dependent protein kinase regulator